MDPLNAYISKIEETVADKYRSADYKDCYVAFLDIMGVKKKVTTQDYDTIWKIFSSIESSSHLYESTSVPGGDKFISEAQVQLTIMSDSIVLSIDSKTDQALAKIIGICSYLIKKVIKYPNKPVFIRGGITRGDIFHVGNIVFGPALIRAYNIENKKAVNMRCIIDPVLHNDQQMEDYTNSNSNALTFDEEDQLYFIEMVTDDNKDDLREISDQVLASEAESAIKEKYRWLLDHVESQADV